MCTSQYSEYFVPFLTGGSRNDLRKAEQCFNHGSHTGLGDPEEEFQYEPPKDHFIFTGGDPTDCGDAAAFPKQVMERLHRFDHGCLLRA